MNTETTNQQQPQLLSGPHVGRVKWFNDTTGFGFIKTMESHTDFGIEEGGDIFVHVSDIKPQHNTFNPAIYTGEYVQFYVVPNGQDKGGNRRVKAGLITGVAGGPLLCDHGEIKFRSYSRIGFEKSVAGQSREEEEEVNNEV